MGRQSQDSRGKVTFEQRPEGGESRFCGHLEEEQMVGELGAMRRVQGNQGAFCVWCRVSGRSPGRRGLLAPPPAGGEGRSHDKADKCLGEW